MTALPVPTLPAPAEQPDARHWIALADAAEALDRDAGHLRRQCAEQLQPMGYAVKAPSPSGGDRWYVARSWHPRLSAGDIGDLYKPASLEGFTDRQRATAMARAACVDAYREMRKTATKITEAESTLVNKLRRKYADELPGFKVSSRTLRRWAEVYRRPADLVKLIDTRGGNTRAQPDPAAWAFFRSIFRDERRPSIRVCWERTRDEARVEGWRWCSYDACRKRLDEVIPPEQQAQFREPEAYRSKFRPYIPQDPEAFFAGERWDGDHAVLDLWCRFDGKVIRPWITAWMDWRTRKVVGWCLSDKPNTSTILAALRIALTDESNFGGPDLVWIDNGKDYDSYSLQGQTKKERQKVRRQVNRFRLDESKAGGVFSQLGIDVHFSIPRNPNGKARIERWFGTLHDRLDKSFPTYAGRSPDTRPEGLKTKLKDGRNIPDFEHVHARLADFIRGYNASTEHQRKDMVGWSSDQALAEWCPRRKRLANPAAVDLILQHWHQPVRVGKNGVTIKPFGKAISYGQHEPALRRLKGTGQRVRVSYDPADVTTVRVYTEAGDFVCAATANAVGYGVRGKVSGQQVKDAIKAQRQHKAKRREIAREASYEYLTTFEIAQREAAEDGPPPPTDDAPLQLIQTPLDRASEQVERAELKKAAGAESASPGFDLADLIGRMSPVERLTQARRDEDDDALTLGGWSLGGDATQPDEDTDGLNFLESIAAEGGGL